jgi:hypothetical protein
MNANAVFFGWNRSIPGRERMSGQHFTEFVQYLEGLKKQGKIQSFDAVFLNHHGGDMNGFFLIKGNSPGIQGMVASEEWATHMVRADMHLEGSGAVLGQTGDLLMKMFELWSKNIPA